MASLTGRLTKLNKVIRLNRRGCTNRPFYHIVVQKVNIAIYHLNYVNFTIFKYYITTYGHWVLLHVFIYTLFPLLNFNREINHFFCLLAERYPRWKRNRTAGQLRSHAQRKQWKTRGFEFRTNPVLDWPGSHCQPTCRTVVGLIGIPSHSSHDRDGIVEKSSRGTERKKSPRHSRRCSSSYKS